MCFLDCLYDDTAETLQSGMISLFGLNTHRGCQKGFLVRCGIVDILGQNAQMLIHQTVGVR
jgi:hypothetical protein